MEKIFITSVDIKDKSVVSSGVYERYFKKDGKVYHHILNPFTGYPYDNHLLQVTIISDHSVDGDGLSTTCFALGLNKGGALIEDLDGIKAIFVTDDYNLHYAGY
ncbi:FAD:protein FMN transferase [Muricomes intestini]|uniref:FAD:protein FMN transferase n=1 Tax=Muricomes intestini TaxID=1796634 RepID=UPI002FE163A5